MLDFKIEEDKCIECDLCAQDCQVGIIELNPKPVIRKENGDEQFKMPTLRRHLSHGSTVDIRKKSGKQCFGKR